MGAQWSKWRTGLIALCTLPFLYPFVFLLSVAVRPQHAYIRNPIGLPTSMTLQHFRIAWAQAGLGHAFANTLLAASLSVVVATVTSLMAASWFARHRGRLTNIVLTVVVFGWTIPLIIYLLPLFSVLAHAGLANNLVVLGILYGATNTPFGIYLIYAYLRQIPDEITAASRVDGANLLQHFLWIVVPLARPALATVATLVFMWSWGDLLLAVVMLQDPSSFTLPVAAETLVQRQNPNLQVSAAAAAIAIFPLLALFLVSQRALVRGLTAGVGK
jgi:raffinose/stachyose/melibiose transport system permease protein